MSKILTEAQRKDFFEIIGNPSKDKPIVLNTNVFVKLFAYTKANKGIRFSTDDVITITPNDYNGLAQDCQTRLGIYIINKFIFEDLQIFGYINKEFTDKLFGKIDSNLAKALSNGDITREQYSQYIDRVQWLFGGPIAHIINPEDLTYGLQYSFNEWFVWCGIIKSIAFAFIIASVSSFFGFTVEGGSIEVGKASTNAVVCSSVLILFSDLFLTQLLTK